MVKKKEQKAKIYLIIGLLFVNIFNQTRSLAINIH